MRWAHLSYERAPGFMFRSEASAGPTLVYYLAFCQTMRSSHGQTPQTDPRMALNCRVSPGARLSMGEIDPDVQHVEHGLACTQMWYAVLSPMFRTRPTLVQVVSSGTQSSPQHSQPSRTTLAGEGACGGSKVSLHAMMMNASKRAALEDQMMNPEGRRSN